MPPLKEKVQAPPLSGGYWLNREPTDLAGLHGQVVLVDFWDYTCINCLRTLPYLKAWHQRYAPRGLAILGVHAPEFSFGRDLKAVLRAFERLALPYAVLLDNDFVIWRSFQNPCWPAKYLIDREGFMRYYQFGEGAYQDTERTIQALLTEGKPGERWPEPLPPVRPSDAPGARCFRPTPELHLGYQRGRFGNPQDLLPDAVQVFEDFGRHAEGFAYAAGPWYLGAECVVAAGNGEAASRVSVRYTAREVNLVACPGEDGEGARLLLAQDGQPVELADCGEDLMPAPDGRTAVEIGPPLLYRLVRNRAFGTHTLSVESERAGPALFAFTFVACEVGEA